MKGSMSFNICGDLASLYIDIIDNSVLVYSSLKGYTYLNYDGHISLHCTLLIVFTFNKSGINS